MAQLSKEQLLEAMSAMAATNGNIAAAAALLGIPRATMQNRVTRAQQAGITINKVQPKVTKPRITVTAAMQAVKKAATPEDVLLWIRPRVRSIPEIAAHFSMSESDASSMVETLRDSGVSIVDRADGMVGVDRDPQPAYIKGKIIEYVSRPDNTFKFGATSDNHICSKYARDDVLDSLYDIFAEQEVDRVFNAGNWIDGEARFNTHDLLVHGMDAQCRYLAKVYPQRPGIKTYAVAGDDHEGWYGQREGVDIGRYAERTFQDAGRDDWINLGYMEAHVRLVNYNTGVSSMLSVVHPGGGSSYALSYVIQKIIESLDGGEKPAVALYGHYHKLWAGNIRNVWALQTGTTKDQDPFMRKKRLEAHVGGAVVTLHQDPRTGAITRFLPELIRFFNRGYYNDRWSHSGDVVLPNRTPTDEDLD